MKKQTTRAFTLVELLMVISIIAILASLLLVAIVSAKAKSKQTTCLNNLHQLGLGFTSYTLDFEGKLPMEVASALGGSLEFNSAGLIENTTFSRDFHHFAALSNQIPNARIMTCPADKRRRPAPNYASFSATNLSYFVNTRAVPHATSKILAGDWNIYNANGAAEIQSLAFGREVHRHRGSVLFADGRVEITRTLAYAGDVPKTTIIATAPTAKPPTQTQNPPPPVFEAVRSDRAHPPSEAPTSPASQPTLVTGQSAPPEIIPAPNNSPTPHIPARPKQWTGLQFSKDESTLATPSPPSSESPTAPRSASSAGEEREPWDTPGFRLFKAFAIVSYLISLLWAIILLLILYLRSRLAQREQARAEAIASD